MRPSQPGAKSTEVSFRGSPFFQMSRPRRSSHFRYLTLSLPRMGMSRSVGVWSVRPRRPSGSARARAGRSLLQSFCSTVAGPSPLTRRGVAFSRLLRLLLQIEMNGRERRREGGRGEDVSVLCFVGDGAPSLVIPLMALGPRITTHPISRRAALRVSVAHSHFQWFLR